MSDTKLTEKLAADVAALRKELDAEKLKNAALKKIVLNNSTASAANTATLKTMGAKTEEKAKATPKPKAVKSPVTIGEDKYTINQVAWMDNGTKVLAQDVAKDEKQLAYHLDKYPSLFDAVK